MNTCILIEIKAKYGILPHQYSYLRNKTVANIRSIMSSNKFVANVNKTEILNHTRIMGATRERVTWTRRYRWTAIIT